MLVKSTKIEACDTDIIRDEKERGREREDEKSASPQGCKHLFTPQATPLGGELRTLLYFNNPYKVGPRSGAHANSGICENVCTAGSQ